MQKKRLAASVAALLLVLCTACGSPKTALTADQFTQQTKSDGFEVVDATAQYAADAVDSVTIAVCNDYQLEFYIVPTEDQMKTAYASNKATFEAQKGNGGSTSKEVNLANYNTYTQTVNGQFYLLTRVDNTMLYCVADEAYADDIKDKVEALGYL